MKRFIAVAMVAMATVAGTSVAANAQMAAPAATEPDIRALVGTWDGWWIGGGSSPLEVTIHPDGTYLSRLGSVSGTGTFRIVDSVIVTEGHLNGAGAALSDRTASVTLVQKNGAAMLTGDGRTSAGPYSFTLTKR